MLVCYKECWFVPKNVGSFVYEYYLDHDCIQYARATSVYLELPVPTFAGSEKRQEPRPLFTCADDSEV